MCKITKENRCCLKIEDVTYCYDGERLQYGSISLAVFQKGKFMQSVVRVVVEKVRFYICWMD